VALASLQAAKLPLARLNGAASWPCVAPEGLASI
jgi:hypothetical protein